jgi:hypothetical protein
MLFLSGCQTRLDLQSEMSVLGDFLKVLKKLEKN